MFIILLNRPRHLTPSLPWFTKRAPTRLALSHSSNSKLRACRECTHHTGLKLLMIRACGTPPLSPLTVSSRTRTSLENGISSKRKEKNSGWLRTVGCGWASRPASFSVSCCVLCVILEFTRNSSLPWDSDNISPDPQGCLSF